MFIDLKCIVNLITLLRSNVKTDKFFWFIWVDAGTCMFTFNTLEYTM